MSRGYCSSPWEHERKGEDAARFGGWPDREMEREARHGDACAKSYMDGFERQQERRAEERREEERAEERRLEHRREEQRRREQARQEEEEAAAMEREQAAAMEQEQAEALRQDEADAAFDEHDAGRVAAASHDSVDEDA